MSVVIPCVGVILIIARERVEYAGMTVELELMTVDQEVEACRLVSVLLKTRVNVIAVGLVNGVDGLMMIYMTHAKTCKQKSMLFYDISIIVRNPIISISLSSSSSSSSISIVFTKIVMSI